MRHAHPITRPLALAAAACGMALIAAPTVAQTYYGPTVEELTVTPRLGPDGRPATLSRVVSIADLDLRYDRDVREMQRRVRTTARQICNELGDTDSRLTLTQPSCTEDAVRSAQRQVNFAIAQARSSTYYAYAPAAPYAVAPYAGAYAPPASAYVPEPRDPDAF
ncbi:MAG: UrcA family protein [Phenylobacterium sp.]